MLSQICVIWPGLDKNSRGYALQSTMESDRTCLNYYMIISNRCLEEIVGTCQPGLNKT